MQLKSQTICPTVVRARLVTDLGDQDNAIRDMKLALEVAEDTCFELNRENIKLKDAVVLAADKIKLLQEKIKEKDIIL